MNIKCDRIQLHIKKPYPLNLNAHNQVSIIGVLFTGILIDTRSLRPLKPVHDADRILKIQDLKFFLQEAEDRCNWSLAEKLKRQLIHHTSIFEKISQLERNKRDAISSSNYKKASDISKRMVRFQNINFEKVVNKKERYNPFRDREFNSQFNRLVNRVEKKGGRGKGRYGSILLYDIYNSDANVIAVWV